MRRNRSVKIVATLGPASATREMIEKLFLAGADVFRVNFSHGTHAEHKERIGFVRAVERKHGRPIAILMDLQGPKLRVGRLAGGGIDLVQGETFRLDLKTEPGDATRAPLPHPEVFAALRKDTEILLDDGRLRLRVVRLGKDFTETEVVTGGRLTDHKGVNLPNAVLDISPITAKDRDDLRFGLDQGIDYVGLSFVQHAKDVAEAQKLVGRRAGVLAKIEKPAAIEHLDEIIALSDAVMVARGDLGVELPPENVPIEQRNIIKRCRLAGKPVVVATQMLESMVNSPAPTRAEASDVATAVYEGTDAVMLSAETAAGKYPLEAVGIMSRIIAKVEAAPDYWTNMDAAHPDPEATATHAITAAARQVARTVRAAAIVTYTSSGSTAFKAARERPNVPILCLTESIATARRLALAWSVHCVVTGDVRDFGSMVDKACAIARQEGFAKNGQALAITAGVPFGTPGATNVLRIAWVGE